jgi:8-oxo-dGTP pyrophosphatase MutT (NUDIX family)
VSEELDIPVVSGEEAGDLPELWEIRSRRRLATGRLFDFLTDEVVTPSGEVMHRDFIDHTGAVAVIAMDTDERVVCVHQYRHPVAYRLIEPPAGLLDIAGEDFLIAAQRELAEEAGLAASDWRVLVDFFTTPGGVNESIRVYLARGLSVAEPDPEFVVEHEEAHMDVLCVPYADLVDGVLSGRVQSPSMVAGVLAYAAARERLDQLRPADAPWPARTQFDLLRSARTVNGATAD